MSELFRESFRVYYAREVDGWFQELADFAATHNPHGYTEADIPRLIKEVRAEDAAEKAALRSRRRLDCSHRHERLDLSPSVRRIEQRSEPAIETGYSG